MIRFKKIQPATILGSTANVITITSVFVDLFRGCTVNYELLEATFSTVGGVESIASSESLMTNSVFLDDEAYENWGEDDYYIHEQVALKLGLTIVT
jgi:hypothetical protein